MACSFLYFSYSSCEVTLNFVSKSFLFLIWASLLLWFLFISSINFFSCLSANLQLSKYISFCLSYLFFWIFVDSIIFFNFSKFFLFSPNKNEVKSAVGDMISVKIFFDMEVKFSKCFSKS